MLLARHPGRKRTGKDLVEALQQLQERMRARHMSLQQGALPVAVYAARELRKYLAGGKSDIANKDAAELFYRALVGMMEETAGTGSEASPGRSGLVSRARGPRRLRCAQVRSG